MKRSAIISLFLCAFAFILSADYFALSGQNERNYAGWWIKHYGALEGKDHPLVPRVYKVFDKVLDAADKRGTHFPKLIILRGTDGNLALALRDGTVILSPKAMDICYRLRDKTIGDARMAFIIGHELAHLANGDFWEYESSESSKSSENLETGPSLFPVTDSADIMNKKELKADAYGLLYAAMAGYDPKNIVNTRGKDFFRELVSERKSDHATISHPSHKKRADKLISNMEAVVKDIDFFYIGVRLYQVGMYKDALLFLNTFSGKFPCREVFNNIGIIHYQMTMRKLAKCDPGIAYQFRLPIIPDMQTRAETYARKGHFRRRGCDRITFKDSIRYLRDACDKDKFYITGRINYSSALIMEEKYSEAMGKIMDEALVIDKDDPNALNNLAIAIYLLGPSPYIKVDMFKDATDILKELIQKHPEFPIPYYNLGRIQAERGRNAAARETWNTYLKLEPFGVYAETARDALELDNRASDLKPASKPFYEPLPVRLGNIRESGGQLKGLAKRTLSLGRVHCEYYSGNKGMRVLVLDDAVELVETPVKVSMNLSELVSAYGKPLKSFKTTSDTSTFVYDNFAVDIQNNKVTKVIHFGKKRIQ